MSFNAAMDIVLNIATTSVRTKPETQFYDQVLHYLRPWVKESTSTVQIHDVKGKIWGMNVRIMRMPQSVVALLLEYSFGYKTFNILVSELSMLSNFFTWSSCQANGNNDHRNQAPVDTTSLMAWRLVRHAIADTTSPMMSLASWLQSWIL